MPRVSSTTPDPLDGDEIRDQEGDIPAADEEVQGQLLLDPDEDFGFYTLDDTSEELNLLYYGREGTGKTTAAAFMANLPDANRVLIINVEAGAKRAALRKRGVDTSKIVMWPPRGQRIGFKNLERLHQRLLADLLEDPTSWTGVIWDSVTEIATALREDAQGKRIDKMHTKGVSVDEDESDVSDYTILGDQMRKLLRRFRDLPCHFVATALEREDTKTGYVGPDVTPAVARAILGYVDIALYCRADVEAAGETEDDYGAEFRALTRANSKYRAKDRYDVTPKVLADPNFLRVALYVDGDLDEDSDPLQVEYNRRREQRAEAEAAKAQERAEAKAAAKAKKAA